MAEQFNGVYAGTALNANDPEKRGRLQVMVPSRALSGWAYPCWPYKVSASPPAGTEVRAMFEEGYPFYPVWIGCSGN
jgi:hypothetical protein